MGLFIMISCSFPTGTYFWDNGLGLKPSNKKNTCLRNISVVRNVAALYRLEYRREL